MVSFSQLPASDRWDTLDRELPKIIAEMATASQIDPTAEINLVDLADRHGCTVGTMRKQLTALGAVPYRIGKHWHVRRAGYAAALARAEANAAPSVS